MYGSYSPCYVAVFIFFTITLSLKDGVIERLETGIIIGKYAEF